MDINGEQGEYREDGQVNGHPYTIFNRDRGLEEQLVETRNKVKDSINKHFKDIYKKFIYSFTSYQSPAAGGAAVNMDPAAIRAKNAAFVYLLAVDTLGNSIKSSTYHNDLKENALRMLEEVNLKVSYKPNNTSAWQRGSKKMMMMSASSVCFITCILIS